MLLYWIRVIALSFEALVLFAAGMIWLVFKPELDSLANALSLSEEFLRYMLVAPVGIGMWVVNESRLLLQEDKESIRVLTEWPDYPLLKAHVWVGLIYCFIFAAVSLVPWAAKSGISNGTGLLLFLTAIAGQFIVASSVYAARIKVRELLAHASAA
ncbi:hypothetical protein [Diaphorobacter sp. ED-3]|uniref:hypothetical protein n=1 Tax=Diaphorobacter sp. ED-3 TaxID=3016636 RepID=UPI0022DD99E8|nr:hypothetical protein [Diaphorobacter sp. ED-3]